MADAADSKSAGRKAVWVRLPPPVPSLRFVRFTSNPFKSKNFYKRSKNIY